MYSAGRFMTTALVPDGTVPEGSSGPEADSARSAPVAGEPRNTWTLGSVFRAYRWRLLLVYVVVSLENVLYLAQPFALGLAISDLLRSSYRGLAVFALQHLGHLLTGVCRRMYDTRVFTGVYTELATGLVVAQRGRNVEVSRVAARSALSREVVTFFERDVPTLVQTVYWVVGALVMLAFYDVVLVPVCLALLLPVSVLNVFYARKALTLNGRLNDELEREVHVISGGQAAEVRGHYAGVAGWRIKLSDREAANFGGTEVFLLGLMATALVRSCAVLGGDVGNVVAVFRYVLMFVLGLDSVPVLVQQLSRLRDITRRVTAL
jgi:hypothetical protein